MNTTTFYHSRIRYFTSPSLHRAVVEVERPGDVNSFIGSGRNNHVETLSNDSAIVGGENNLLAGGDQRYSFIGSGLNNTISSPCASIIGGAGNNIPAGLPNAHIIGSGITAAALPAGNGGLFVNELVIQNIPAVTLLTYPLLQPGQLYTVVAGAGFTNRPVYVV